MRGKICEYSPCYVAEITGRDCADSDNCQTKKFYNKYGLDYLSLGNEKRIDSKCLGKCIK